MLFTWKFWPNQQCADLDTNETAFMTKRFICFSNLESARNSAHTVATTKQKMLAETLLSLTDDDKKIVHDISFSERGIGITLTSIVRWKTAGPQIEAAIKNLFEGSTFNPAVKW
jgi:hypothetical protein